MKKIFLIAVLCWAGAGYALDCPEMNLKTSWAHKPFRNKDKALGNIPNLHRKLRTETYALNFQVVAAPVQNFNPEDYRVCAQRFAEEVAAEARPILTANAHSVTDSRGREFACQGGAKFKMKGGATVEGSLCVGKIFSITKFEGDKLAAGPVSGVYDAAKSGIAYSYAYSIPLEIEAENVWLAVDLTKGEEVLDGRSIESQD